MSVWTWIKGIGKAGKVVDTGLDLITKGAKGLDVAFFTEEEKARHAGEMLPVLMAHAVEMNRIANSESSIKSITRRYLALGIIGTYLGIIAGCVTLALLNDTETLKTILTVLQALKFHVAALAVVFFYFGYYAISNIVSSAKR